MAYSLFIIIHDIFVLLTFLNISISASRPMDMRYNVYINQKKILVNRQTK